MIELIIPVFIDENRFLGDGLFDYLSEDTNIFALEIKREYKSEDKKRNKPINLVYLSDLIKKYVKEYEKTKKEKVVGIELTVK